VIPPTRVNRHIAGVNIPDLDVVVMAYPNDAGVAGADIGRTIEQTIGHAIGAGIQAETRSADRIVQVAVDDRLVVGAKRAPDEVVAIAHRGYPCGTPARRVRPQPAVPGMVVPAAVMRRHIGKRIVINPTVPIDRDVTPVTVAVRHVVDNHRRPPIVTTIDINPIAIRSKRGGPYHGRLNNFGWQFLVSCREVFRALAAPCIKIVFDVSIEHHRRGRKVTGVHKDALARRNLKRSSNIRADLDIAPANGDSSRTLIQDVYAHVGLGRDFHPACGRDKQEIPRAACDALNVKRPSPTSYGSTRGEVDDLYLTAVRHSKEAAAGHFNFHGPALVGPELVTGQDEGVGGGVAPVGIGRTLNHRAAGLVTDARVHGGLGYGVRSGPTHSQRYGGDKVCSLVGSHDLNLLKSSLRSAQLDEHGERTFIGSGHGSRKNGADPIVLGHQQSPRTRQARDGDRNTAPYLIIS